MPVTSGPYAQIALAASALLLVAVAVLQVALVVQSRRANREPSHRRRRIPLAAAEAFVATARAARTPPSAELTALLPATRTPVALAARPAGDGPDDVVDDGPERFGEVGGAIVRAVVAAGPMLLDVSLVGVRPGRGAAPFRWAGRAADGPGGPGVVVLGEHPRLGALVVDLARAPDVVTVTGSPAERLAYARQLARQLVAGGAAVTAGQDVLGPGAGRPAHARSATSAVVFRTGPGGPPEPPSPDATILVGDLPRARWSIDARSR
ncbi:hypothetical protein [Dactylosporangium sp. CA-233914]|uniref:hypothetical protein n=1 Tax=Dactylosporangium sp. CA-233914 TaxID=3239934 RepID=UPI003D8A09AD